MRDLLAVGLTTLDILGASVDALPAGDEVVLIGGIDVVPAGTAGAVALVAAVLGAQTGLVSALGDDRVGRFVRMVLEEHGVDTTLVPSVPGMRSSATILPIDSQGRRPALHALGAAMLVEITPEAITAASRTRAIHWGAIGAPRIDPGARDRFLAAGRQAGATISCDLIAPGPNAARDVAAILPALDCFMPSLTEARFLSGHDDPRDAAAAFLAGGARQCVIKLGAQGLLLATPAGIEIMPAFDVPVVDTTSCGDAFCAGYLVGIGHGWSAAESCRFGAATAALVAQGLGTLGRLTGLEQVISQLGTLRQRRTL